ncbi:MAG: HigA family addiction module antitoxin [Saccharospirillaceae bacterium]|nr:HigA family addiction module antitoxin [Saccharospirillaceae bacterium]MCD8530629.1 HigA family addiction module antitoxin [Saccharospirillaceae bacterium]
MTNVSNVLKPRFKPSHPGLVFKRQVLEGYELSITEAARRLGVSRKHLTNFSNGHVPCSLDLAQRIAAATGSGVAVWINLQANYDTWLAEHTDTPDVVAFG